MRRTISGMIAVIAVMTASAAQACGGGLFQGSCSPCGWGYASRCAPALGYGCNSGCAGFERLPDPVPHHYTDYVHQYYYVNQGPTYSGPGNFAPYPVYEEGSVSGWEAYGQRSYRGYRGHGHGVHAYRDGMHPHYRGHDHMMHEHMHHD
jgi:hypothetical protein